jgi:hypothetical protein
MLMHYPVTASGFHFIGKETERGWEQAEDISTLLLLTAALARAVPQEPPAQSRTVNCWKG